MSILLRIHFFNGWRSLLAIVLMCGLPAHAAYYANTPTTYSWIDPVAGGHSTAVFTNGASCTGGFSAPQDDDITVQIPLGFAFNFGGTGYTQLQIMSNGRLQFNNTFCGYGTETVGPPPTYPFDFPNGTPSSIGAVNVSRMMRVYGADFDIGASLPGGAVYYATLGTAPNRRFVVTWKDIREWNSPGSLFNVQIILYENGDFAYQYKDTVNLTAGHAQIGWQISPTDYDVLPYVGFGSLAYSATLFYAAPKVGDWRMDDLAWSGAAGEVVDSSGNGYNGQAQNGPSTISTTAAIPGNPGTCRYGQFDGNNDHILLPAGIPNLTQSFTITAWIRTTNRGKSGQRIFIDDESNTGGYGFSLGDGGAGILRFYSRGSSPVILDTGAVIQDNIWYFVAAVADLSTGFKYMFVFDASGASVASVSDAFSGWGTDSGRASIGGETNASTEASSSFRFQGNLDEVKVYRGALPKTILAALSRETRACPIEGVTLGGFNVFESSTPLGSTTGYIKTKVAGKAFNLSTGNLAIVALNGGVIDTAFTGTVRVELLNAAAGGVLDANGCNGSWPVVATLANQTFGAGGRINMSPVPQINNAAYQNLKVRVSYPTASPTKIGCSNDSFALRPDRLDLGNATHFDWQTAGTATTLNNVGTSGGQVHKAWQYFTLTASARDALGNNAATYSGSPVGTIGAILLPSGCASCAPGIVEAGGWSGSGTITSNTARVSEVGTFGLYLEDRSFAAVDAIDSVPGERYIASGPGTIGRFVPDHFDVAMLVTPLLKTFNATDAQCNTGIPVPRRSFTYIGQPFGYLTTPQATIIARNANNATTVNYQGALWKIGGAAGVAIPPNCASAPDANTCLYTTPFTSSKVTETYTYTLDTGATPGWAAPLATWAAAATVTPDVGVPGTGKITFATSDLIAFLRSSTTPQTPFVATINNAIKVEDNSEVPGAITTTNPAQFNGIAFDATYLPLAQPNKFFYGRLRLQNANGSQLISMPVPIQTQYWNGSAFVTNNADHCTTLAVGNIALGNYQRNLAAGETTGTVGGAFNSGVGSLRLSAPGSANDGSVDVSVNLTTTAAGASCTAGMPASTGSGLSWLQGAWCGATYANDPTARATFGVYRNSDQFIYQRENY